jgi:hypothetical protein
LENVEAARQNLYELRDSFAKYYTQKRITNMPIEHYALGNDLPNEGYHFCYTLERSLDGLGRVTGATRLYGNINKKSHQTRTVHF